MARALRMRIWAIVLTLCLIAAVIPTVTPTEVEAISGVNSLTCAGFISNHIAQKYIDTMMRYYINNNSSLQTQLNNGRSVVFMFEGGSDNYWNGSTYYNGVGDVRNQAVCIVVQSDSSGNCYIAYYCENSSSIPDNPKACTNGVGYSGATTVKDGLHYFYTWNHTGPYGAFQLDLSEGYYTPTANPNGYTLGASGLNIHTRSTNTCNGVDWHWSLGCQVIGSGYGTGNEFNQFMKTVAGISYNVWLDYSSKSFNTISTGTYKGIYVVDRQLGKMDINGNQFGSGSLIALYNSTALNNITAASTTARNAAGFSLDYKDQCERYASYCTLNVTAADTQVRGAPCSEGTDPASTLIEMLQPGKQVTAVGIYKNLYGNYWYEVLTSGGQLGYIYSGNVEYVDDIISDISLTGDSTPNGHVKGATFYVDGTVASKYNELSSVACYIYNGFNAATGSSTGMVTGASDTPTSNSYALKYSAVDDATWMGALDVGNYTYAIYATYKNYYATSPTTLQSNTGTLTLKDENFVVIPAAADQSTCTHTNTEHVMKESTCLQDGLTIVSCSTCGKITETVTTGGHAYGSWSTTTQPTCTATGTQSRTCSRCGGVDTQSIPAVGHSYSSKTHPATCLEYERIEYTCHVCGHSYSVYADELMSQWLETYPEGVDPSLIQQKTQYRYSDYETITSSKASVDGYTQLSQTWEKTGSGNVRYVSAWPDGFDTSHSVCDPYSKSMLGVTNSNTTKREYDSTGKLVGYVYYHWCYGTYTAGPINRTTSKYNDGSHTTFHAFAEIGGSVDPTKLTPASDGSITYANASGCTDSHWWYYIPIYQDDYSTYTAKYTHGRWGDWSDWSDDAVTASDTRKVETRTVYRYADAQYGDHAWVEGVCTTCGTVCEHDYVEGFCTVCAMAEPIKDYYLFGWINGSNYACEEDFMNMGQYLFVDGKLTTSFESDSYVAVKTGGNGKWFMADGYPGDAATSATLYDGSTLSSPDKLRVPAGSQITFTLTVNTDGTVTLSYEKGQCYHRSWTAGICDYCGTSCAHGSWTDGLCDTCGNGCHHKYVRNICTVCNMRKPVKDYYLFGFINGADYGCEADYATIGEYKFVDNKLTARFTGDSYVAVKSGDNQDWYMTNTWLGYETTAATLYNTQNLETAEKLYVPGGVEVTFYLIDNGNDTYTLSYVVTEPEAVVPTLTLKYPSLSFEDEIFYNIYYIAENVDDVVQMGLLTFDSAPKTVSIDTATDVIEGFDSDGTYCMVRTNGISAKNLGDTLYFAVYARLSDGSYVYTAAKSYSARTYANTILGRASSSDYMKDLVVAMLNYGTEAQLYFGHRTDDLMNAALTEDQRSRVDAYNDGMVAALPTVSAAKAGAFVYDGSSFARRSPTVSFDSAFSINFYFTPAHKVDGEMTLYYWGPRAYKSASVLTPENATGSMVMELDESGQYWGDLVGIAAKQLDQVGYFAGVYQSGGVTYTTGVLVYSLGRYCQTVAARPSSDMKDLAAATAVYGYYAKEYFSNL